MEGGINWNEEGWQMRETEEITFVRKKTKERLPDKA